MKRGAELTYHAAREYRDFVDAYGLDGNCHCHLSPSCGSCTHPGNPRNQAEDDDAWMWGDMTELLDHAEQAARDAVAACVDAAAARHLSAMGVRSRYLQIGDAVVDSPVGAGTITDITETGFPRINNIGVAWLVRSDGAVFDPFGSRDKNFDARMTPLKQTF